MTPPACYPQPVVSSSSEQLDRSRGLLNCLAEPRDQSSASRGTPRSASDWGQVLALATLHNVAPLLYDRLIHASRITHHVPPYQPSTPELSTTPVPSNVLQRLREIHLMTGARNALLYRELGLVLQALQQENIPVIVLKGAHLAALVYRHIALRPISDLDLLVHPSDLERAAARLRDLGFSGPPTGDIAVLCKESQNLPMLYKAPETGIELHWTPLSPTRLPAIANDGWWQRSRPATIAGAPTRVLSPEDLLLHVCLHDACNQPHGPFGLGLRPLSDIAEIIRRYRETLSWPEVQARAVEWRTERCVYLALWLARELLGAEVPESIMGGLCPRDFDERWAAVARKQVLEAPEAASRVAGLPEAPWRVWVFRYRSLWRRGRNTSPIRAVVRAVFPRASTWPTIWPGATRCRSTGFGATRVT